MALPQRTAPIAMMSHVYQPPWGTSVQPRRAQEAGAVGRFHAHRHVAGVAPQPERDGGAGAAARPQLAPEAGEFRHLLVTEGEDAVAGLHARLRGRTVIGEAAHHQPAFALHGVEPEPGTR